VFVPLDENSARQAAELRAYYDITLTDALQISTALKTSCQAFIPLVRIYKACSWLLCYQTVKRVEPARMRARIQAVAHLPKAHCRTLTALCDWVIILVENE